MVVAILGPVLMGPFVPATDRGKGGMLRRTELTGPRGVPPADRLRPPGPGALHRPACSRASSEHQLFGARRNGNKAAIDRQESGRSIEGRRRWTYR